MGKSEDILYTLIFTVFFVGIELVSALCLHVFSTNILRLSFATAESIIGIYHIFCITSIGTIATIIITYIIMKDNYKYETICFIFGVITGIGIFIIFVMMYNETYLTKITETYLDKLVNNILLY